MNNMEKNKSKRRSISLETKSAILDRISKGEGSTALGKEFGLAESTIRGIRKRANVIHKSSGCATRESATRASYSRNTLIEKTEKALVLWIQELTLNGIPYDGELIKAKAKLFYNLVKHSEPSGSSHSIGNQKFSASNGWLSGFFRRHALHSPKVKSETASANEAAAKNYAEELARIIEDGGYCPDQVFNADETGLFWKKMPSRTFIAKSEKAASGFKAAKDRVTFLLCSNASGARMLKPLIINKSLHPLALEGKNLAELPVHFMVSENARITPNIFTMWFNDCFVPEVEKYMTEIGLHFKVLLIVDKAPSHPCLEYPNVKVVFFPPNTTSLLQPLDQGISEAFKKHYVKFTFRYLIDKLQKDLLTVTEAWKSFTIFDCINHAAAAVGEIKQHTLNACWKAVWPECVIKRNAIQTTWDLSAEIIALAHEIPGEGFIPFEESDIDEMIQDELPSDSDIIDFLRKSTDDYDEPNSMTESNIYAGLQIWNKLESHFLAIDANSERSLKFQNDLGSCMSVYRDMYKRLTDKPLLEEPITDSVVPQKMLAVNKFEIESASEESDFEPVFYNKIRKLDYDEQF